MLSVTKSSAARWSKYTTKKTQSPKVCAQRTRVFACFLLFFFLSLSFWLCIALWCAVCRSAPDRVRRPLARWWMCYAGSEGTLYNTVISGPARTASCFPQRNRSQLLSFRCAVLAAKVACSCGQHLAKSVPITCIPETAVGWGMTLLKGHNEKMVPNSLTLLHFIKLPHCAWRMLMVYLVRWSRPWRPM